MEKIRDAITFIPQDSSMQAFRCRKTRKVSVDLDDTVNASTYEIVDLHIESDSLVAREAEDETDQNEAALDDAEPKSEAGDSQRQMRNRRGRGARNEDGRPLDAPAARAQGKSTALAHAEDRWQKLFQAEACPVDFESALDSAKEPSIKSPDRSTSRYEVLANLKKRYEQRNSPKPASSKLNDNSVNSGQLDKRTDARIDKTLIDPQDKESSPIKSLTKSLKHRSSVKSLNQTAEPDRKALSRLTS